MQGTFSAGSGYMVNTTHDTYSPRFVQDFTNDDSTLKFRFRIAGSSTNSDPRAYVALRANTTGSADDIGISFIKATNKLRLAQNVNGTFSDLVNNTSLEVAYDTDYDVQVVADGRHIEVRWAQAGQTMTKIAETDSATVLEGPRLYFGTQPNTVARFDNIEFTAVDPKTTTFTYDDANELLTMVDGATTTFTYDNWGRQVSKVQGAYTAQVC